MPDYLSQLAKYNEENNITATFSEMKKTARRMQKLDDETGLHVDIDAYCLDYWDETGELAIDNVLAENATNAARRIAA